MKVKASSNFQFIYINFSEILPHMDFTTNGKSNFAGALVVKLKTVRFTRLLDWIWIAASFWFVFTRLASSPSFGSQFLLHIFSAVYVGACSNSSFWYILVRASIATKLFLPFQETGLMRHEKLFPDPE